MYRYKRGEKCPFCGQKIPDDATPAQLYAISILAASMEVVDHNRMPREEIKKVLPEIRCNLPSKLCPANAYRDHRCCKVCELKDKCTYGCQNNPGRCGQSKTLFPADETDGGE